MTDATALLEDLQARGVKLRVEAGKLRFSGPKDVVTGDVIDKLRTHKANLIPLVLAAAVDGSRPSINQQAFHLAHKVDPQGWGLHNILAYEVTPGLDPALVKAASDHVVERHEALSLVFREDEGELRCVYKPLEDRHFAHVPIPASADLRAEVQRHAYEPFDVATGPLFKVRLFTSGARQVLLVTMHHLISDGYSLFLVVRELKYFYACLAAGRRPDLPSPLGKFVEYLSWEQHLEGSAEEATLLSQWRRRVRPEVPATTLPFAKNVGPQSAYQAKSHLCHLTPQLSDQLTKLAAASNVSVFSVFLAGLNALLHRLAEQSDIAIGVPMLNRARFDAMDCVGFYSNNSVLQCSVTSETSFRQLLLTVQQAMTQTLEGESYPYPLLVKHLNPQRAGNRTPFFEVALDSLLFRPVPELEDEFDRRHTLLDLDVVQGVGELSLLLWLRRDASHFWFNVRYNGQVFTEESIGNLEACLIALLEDAAAHPDRAVSELEVLGPSHKQKILRDWNATDAAVPRGTMANLLFDRARACPDRVAVRFHDDAIDYRELHRRARAIAQLLVERGIEPGRRVGVCLRRSIDLLPTVLGIWHAGAVHVPIDPALPRSRREHIVELSSLTALFVEDDDGDRQRAGANLTTIPTQAIAAALTTGSLAPEAPLATDANELAYIIFTSGSTGQPKGVRVTHRSLCNFSATMIDRVGYRAAESSLAVVSISFDVFFTDIACALVSGGEVIVADDRATTDGRALFEEIRRHGVTRMMATPSTWSIVAPYLYEHGIRVRQCLAGGEPLPLDLMRRLHQVADEVWNLYGPAEATVWATAARLERDADEVRIGRPLANTQVYVLDPRGRPVPLEIPGEIYLGGVCVADGYEANPGETAQRFLANHLDPDRGGSLYRTGDFGMFRADGELRFLGRRDGQVKIRGYRIELGEIEIVLKRHPDVSDAVVLKLGEESNSVLRAYVVPRTGQQPDGESLARFVGETLPSYMVPSGYTFLDQLPYNNSRKIDRLALAALEPTSPASPAAPSSAPPALEGLSAELARIWAVTLQVPVERITGNHNFFELGGNSLLLNRLQFALNQRLGIALTTVDLFRFPTIERLAAHVREMGQGPPQPQQPDVMDQGRQRSAFLQSRRRRSE